MKKKQVKLGCRQPTLCEVGIGSYWQDFELSWSNPQLKTEQKDYCSAL
jgi:hypothetical protein